MTIHNTKLQRIIRYTTAVPPTTAVQSPKDTPGLPNFASFPFRIGAVPNKSFPRYVAHDVRWTVSVGQHPGSQTATTASVHSPAASKRQTPTLLSRSAHHETGVQPPYLTPTRRGASPSDFLSWIPRGLILSSRRFLYLCGAFKSFPSYLPPNNPERKVISKFVHLMSKAVITKDFTAVAGPNLSSWDFKITTPHYHKMIAFSP